MTKITLEIKGKEEEVRKITDKKYTAEEAKLVMDKLCKPTNFCYAPMTVLKKGKKK